MSSKNSKPAANFDQVLRDELQAIPGVAERLGAKDPKKKPLDLAHHAKLCGLAFSGGGIRSATFNLGVLQALAERGLLARFDYLSTVSGGGYIGSWLSALVLRKSRERKPVATELDTCWRNRANEESGTPAAESYHVEFLREHSNYLTPHLGVLGMDTLSAISIYLRNLLLNQALLFAVLAFVLLLPRALDQAGRHLQGWLREPLSWSPAVNHGFAAGALMLAGAVVLVVWNLAKDRVEGRPLLKTSGGISWTILPLVLLSTLALAYFLFFAGVAGVDGQILRWMVMVAILYLLPWAAGLIGLLVTGQRGSLHDLLTVPWALLAGAFGGALFWCLAELGDFVNTALTSTAGPGLEIATDRHHPETLWLVPAFGAPLVLVVYMLVITLHIGLMGRRFSESQREWWARLGGLLQRALVGWLLLFTIAYFGEAVVAVLGSWVHAASLGWLATTVASVLAARSPATGGDAGTGRRVLGFLARIGPYVFILGLLVALSFGIETFLRDKAPTCGNSKFVLHYEVADFLQDLSCSSSGSVWPAVLVALVGCAAVAVLLAWRVNINLFSLHDFYRSRLARCYLGATRNKKERQPHPFTGFDPNDELPLKDLVQRPYHIINTALNIMAGKRLAWQTRRAASFVFTPLYSGFDGHAIGSDGDARGFDRGALPCYRSTASYGVRTRPGGVTLGGAFAISGAAASPNMGYHTSPAVAFLMTVFNVRLGRWCANPRFREHIWSGDIDPWFGLYYLALELTAGADLDRDFVYLSDGGHFENLAIYELVRRRCRYIIVSDAGADPDYTFEDLGNAIRKCYVDFGIRVDIDTRKVRPRGDPRQSEAHFAAGLIHYDEVDDGAGKGLLLYIKPSLTGEEPLDVLEYASRDPRFPQQPTSDQWFDESQFESYRKLGHHVARTVFQMIKDHPEMAGKGELEQLLRELGE